MCKDLLTGEVLDRPKIMEIGECFAKDGLRVLGMAYKQIADNEPREPRRRRSRQRETGQHS